MKCGFLTEISSWHCWSPILPSQCSPHWWLRTPVILPLAREQACRLSQKRQNWWPWEQYSIHWWMGNWKIKTSSLLVSKALRHIHLPGFPRCHENPRNSFKHTPRQSTPSDFCSVISHVGSVGTREADRGELLPMWLKHQIIKIINVDSIQYWQACEKTGILM